MNKSEEYIYNLFAFMFASSVIIGLTSDDWIACLIVVILFFLSLLFRDYIEEKFYKDENEDEDKFGSGGGYGDGTCNKDREVKEIIQEPIIEEIKYNLLADLKFEIITDDNNKIDFNKDNPKIDNNTTTNYKPEEKILIKKKEYRDYMYNQSRNNNYNDGLVIPRTRYKDKQESFYEVDKNFKS